jgi:hypothetical protein
MPTDYKKAYKEIPPNFRRKTGSRNILKFSQNDIKLKIKSYVFHFGSCSFGGLKREKLNDNGKISSLKEYNTNG